MALKNKKLVDLSHLSNRMQVKQVRRRDKKLVPYKHTVIDRKKLYNKHFKGQIKGYKVTQGNINAILKAYSEYVLEEILMKNLEFKIHKVLRMRMEKNIDKKTGRPIRKETYGICRTITDENGNKVKRYIKVPNPNKCSYALVLTPILDPGYYKKKYNENLSSYIFRIFKTKKRKLFSHLHNNNI